jgi:glycosyltransferase involved in cell wall biosynthesis
MFSVIIPLYNKSEYITACLNSIINQTYPDFEIIIVNDGSTDDGIKKVYKLLDNSQNSMLNIHHKIKISLINQENSGVSTARNNGVNVANNDYIAFLDADDWWDIHFLEEMKTLIENFPDAGLYGCNFYYAKNGRFIIKDKGFSNEFNMGYINYFKTFGKTFSVLINCSFVVIPRKNLNETGGFNPKLKYGEDFDLWARIALKNKVAYLNKPLSYSNQDAEKSNRAVGNSYIFRPENHFIFNLDYLSDVEQSDPELKLLLDGARVRSLIQYYIHNRYPEEVINTLAKVNMQNQPRYFRFLYKFPKSLIIVFFVLRKYGSFIKQFLIFNFFTWVRKAE